MTHHSGEFMTFKWQP